MDSKRLIYVAVVATLASVLIYLIHYSMQPVDSLKGQQAMQSQERFKSLPDAKNTNNQKKEEEVNVDVDISANKNPEETEKKENEDSGIKLFGFAEKYSKSLDRGITFNMVSADFSSKVKLKGQKIRVETNVQNQKNIVIYSDGYAYSYQPRTGTAIKVDVAAVGKDMKLSSDVISKISEKSGQPATKNGYSCLMFKLNDNDEVCISQRYNIPVYTNISGKIVNYTNITAANISDSDFKLPGNMKIIDVNNLKNIAPSGISLPANN